MGKRTHLARTFGHELARYRDMKGLSRGELAEATHYSFELVKAIELANRTGPEDFVHNCDELLDTRGALPTLWELLHSEMLEPWFQDFVAREREATQIRTFQPLVIPGQLQTYDYARDLIRKGRPTDTEQHVDELATGRVARQTILDRPEPPLLWAVISESALRCPIGDTSVHHTQLTHLLNMARRPAIVVQVLPESVGAHPGMHGPMAILGFTEGPDMIWLEGYDGGRFLVRDDQVAACNVAYDLIRSEALAPDASERFITTMLE